MRMAELDQVRMRSIRMMACAGCLFGVSLAAGVAFGVMNGGWPLVVLAALLNILPVRMALARRHDLQARLMMGVLAAALPAMLTYSFKGHVWQMDMHLFFLVSLAALMLLCDWRPMLLTTVLVALHHLLLDYLAPQWVFAGTATPARVLVHALAMVGEFQVLTLMTLRLQALLGAQAIARANSERLAAEAWLRRRPLFERSVTTLPEGSNAAATRPEIRSSRRSARHDTHEELHLEGPVVHRIDQDPGATDLLNSFGDAMR